MDVDPPGLRGHAGAPLPGAMRDLARRHGVRPDRALGQHFLADPNLARAVAADAGVGPGDAVVEVGAGLGALTTALAESGADVLAVEFDRALIPALVDVVGERGDVRVVQADALHLDWAVILGGHDRWTMCANLPYNIAVPLVLRALEEAPMIERFVVMVQRELGERFAAGPGDPHYGPASVRVGYRARARVLRPVPPSVFWPRPRVGSVVVSLERLAAPPVDAPPEALWRVVDAGFATRRKTMRNALVGSGVDPGRADDVLASCGISGRARAEQLSLEGFACIAAGLAREAA